MVKCKCGTRVRDDFEHKWKHLVTRHPGEFLGQLLPMIWNPALARDAGRRLAETLRGGIS